MNTIGQGSLFLAILLSFSAGLVSFLSPCVLPLVPGYLSFVTGMVGSKNTSVKKSKAVFATFLFISGFTTIFVAIGMFFGGIGGWLIEYSSIIERVMGVFVIILGLSFLGYLNIFQREFKIRFNVKPGLIGAPFLGALFAIGWTPCIGPTLAAVQALAFNQATVFRGATLSIFYGLGLGLPFLMISFILERAINTVTWLRKRQQLFSRIGGSLLVLIGLLLVTGIWSEVTLQLRILISGFTPLI